jgi:hypothetical protein
MVRTRMQTVASKLVSAAPRIVGNRVERHGHALQVQDRQVSPDQEAARLPDRPRVDHPASAAAQAHACVLRRPGGMLGVITGPWAVRVSEDENSCSRSLAREALELGSCLLGTNRVLAWVVERPVSDLNAFGLRTERHRGEKRPRLRVENPLSPREAFPCKRNALRVAELPKRDQVVVPGDIDSVQRLDCGDAFVGEWAITDEIARDQVAVGA